MQQLINKVENALFSKFGEQGVLIQKDGSEVNIELVKRKKTFNVEGKVMVSSSDIRIKTNVKPEIFEAIRLGDKTYTIKASPELIGGNVYSIRIE